MIGTDLEELHAMAERIGLRREWFQRRSRYAHYDLTASLRRAAVAAGAVELARGHLPDDILMRRPDGTYERRGDRLARRRSSA